MDTTELERLADQLLEQEALRYGGIPSEWIAKLAHGVTALLTERRKVAEMVREMKSDKHGGVETDEGYVTCQADYSSNECTCGVSETNTAADAILDMLK